MWRVVVRVVSIAAVVLSGVWFYFEPGFEPAVTTLAGLAGLLSSLIRRRPPVAATPAPAPPELHELTGVQMEHFRKDPVVGPTVRADEERGATFAIPLTRMVPTKLAEGFEYVLTPDGRRCRYYKDASTGAEESFLLVRRPRIAAELKCTPEGPSSGVHKYKLTVSLRNHTTATIERWHADVSVPTEFLNPRTTYVAKVSERSDRTTTLMRGPLASQPRPVYPGDAQIALTVDFEFEKPLVNASPELTKQISVKLFVEGAIKAEEQTTLGSLIGVR